MQNLFSKLAFRAEEADGTVSVRHSMPSDALDAEWAVVGAPVPIDADGQAIVIEVVKVAVGGGPDSRYGGERWDSNALDMFSNADCAPPLGMVGAGKLKLASAGARERVATLGALRKCILPRSASRTRLSESTLVATRAGLVGRGNLGRGRKGRRRGGALDALVCDVNLIRYPLQIGRRNLSKIGENTLMDLND